SRMREPEKKTPEISGAVVGVDADVFVRQIRSVHGSGAVPDSEVNRDGKFLLFENCRAALFGVSAGKDAVPGHADIVKVQGKQRLIDQSSGISDSGEDPAPVGILTEKC